MVAVAWSVASMFELLLGLEGRVILRVDSCTALRCSALFFSERAAVRASGEILALHFLPPG
jgi:hypothetical protein